MKDMVSELVGLDRTARESVEAARVQSQQERGEISREKQSLQEDWRVKADREVARLAEKAKKASLQECQSLETAYQQALAKLEEEFARREQQWTQELFRRCISIGNG